MGLNGVLLINILSVLNFLTLKTVAVDPNCDYSQYLTVKTKYYIYNKEYPSKYTINTNCLWTGQSQPGTRIVVSCEDVDLPSTKNCSGDKLRISLSGDVNFADSRNYCGTGSFSLISNANLVAIGLVSSSISAGGRFVCSLTAIQNFEPPSTTSPPTSTCDCGWKRGTKIVGGVPTLVNEYPAMAGIVNAAVSEVICGSTIISNRYVITAAHCMRNVKLENMGVLVGDWDLSSGTDTSASSLYRAENYWEHPYFDPDTQTNDLAIVKTMKNIEFSLYVGPICLPFLYTFDTFAFDNVTILGWGQEFFNGPSSDILQKVELQVVPNSDCQSQLPDNIITPNQICTYAQNKDACQKDSGGPVIWQDPETLRLQLIGVISYGLGCATSKPGVCTRITNYLPWIIQVTNNTSYCIK
ncbi:venom serine protease-like [Diorhabda sublineata]|uniref:venom serine protease-like n=1 Tax=Diorhabda sublineata TaxID=1163346 RepID=UPI0024E0F34D|nr:venom serine protease-like [Diorhabda sublineata]